MKKLVFLSVVLIMIIVKAVGQEKTCIDCHDNLMNKKVVHPVAEESCDYCHELTGDKHPTRNKKDFSMTDKLPDLCFMCHEIPDGKHTHVPFEEGECTMCHSPHSTDNEKLLVSAPTSNLCFECHFNVFPDDDFLHRPVAEGNCQGCHDPHRSDQKHLLKLQLPYLCFKCHEETGSELKASHVHPPFEDDCQNCHGNHNSKERKLLVSKTPDLCFDCHDDIKKDIESKSVPHKALYLKNNCANCHSPHGSEQESLLIDNETNVCLSCHRKTIKTDDRTIRSMQDVLTKSKVIHGAIEVGGCSSCHFPHAADMTRLLNDNFTFETYVEAKPENFTICFNCHDQEMIEKEKTTDATNFRNRDQNLHFLHVNGAKGRNCIDCHDVHGSVQDHLIAPKVSFGSWEMPINYQVTPNGGSCASGCHAKLSYERK